MYLVERGVDGLSSDNSRQADIDGRFTTFKQNFVQPLAGSHGR
jgi:hypothetical protein